MRQFLKTLKRCRIATSSMALILAFSVLISSFGGLSIFAGIADSAWSGSEANEYASGDGSEGNPFVIETPEQLALLVTDGAEETAGKYYELANDIYLNDVSNSDWKTNAKEWYFENKVSDAFVDANAFAGHFDGKGHIIYGLYIDEKLSHTGTAANYSVAAGLFPIIGAGATITSVAVEKSHISVTTSADDERAAYAGYVGSLGGIILGSKDEDGKRVNIDKCYLNDTTYLAGANLGLIGSGVGASGVSISNCYVTITSANWKAHKFTDANNRPSIMSGYVNNVVFTGCYTASGVNLFGNGGVCHNDSGNNYHAGWVSSTTKATALSTDKMKGIAAATNMSGLDFETVYIETAGYPALRVFGTDTEDDGPKDEPERDPEPTTPIVWDGVTLSKPYGVGTESDPYRIASAANLAYILKNGTSEDKYYIFTQDIYINDVDSINWATGEGEEGYSVNSWFNGAQVNILQGHFDGNGKVVYGLYIKDDTPYASNRFKQYGLFPLAGVVNITGLGIDKAYIEANTDYGVGAMFGRVLQGGTVIDRCYIGDEVTVKGYDIGAFMGGGDPTGLITITNSYSLATLNFSHRGSLVGDSWTPEFLIKGVYVAGHNLISSNSIAAGSLNYFEHNTDTDTIKGDDAKTAMAGLDWSDVFMTVAGEYPILKLFNKMDSSQYWNGTDAIKPTVGEGSKEKPWQIGTPAELAYVVKNGAASGEYYQLVADIYLNDITQITWKNGIVKGGYTANSWYKSDEVAAFAGNFDGNGFHVYGLYYNEEQTTTVSGEIGYGLFPKAGNGIAISKLGLDKSYLEAYTNNSLGAVIGQVGASVTGSVTKTYVGADVVVKGYDAGAFIGGGYRTADFTVENCYSLATVNYTHRGGLISDTWQNGYGKWYVKSTYAAGTDINQGSATEGIKIFGNSSGACSCSNVYAIQGEASGITLVSAEDMKGLNVLTDGMPNLDKEAFRATESYPQIAEFLPLTPIPEAGVWDGSVAQSYARGSGTEAAPYLIHNASELALLVSTGGGAGKFYKIVNDIYINDPAIFDHTTGGLKEGKTGDIREWVKGATFTATLDGDGHVIYGLYFDVAGEKKSASSGYALFRVAGGNATIKNLGIDNAFVNGPNGAAAFVGYNAATLLTISYSYVGANVTINGNDAGAFVSVSDHPTALDHVYNWGTLIAANGRWKGLIGDMWEYGTYKGVSGSSITNAYNATGPINSKIAVHTIENSFASVSGGGGTVVSAENMTGLTVFNNKKPMQSLNADKSWQATSGYPILDIFADDPYGPDGDEFVPPSGMDENGVWDGMIAKAFSDSSVGTEDDPILIANPAELALAIKSGGNGKYYRLTADIILNETRLSKLWYEGENLNKWYGESNGGSTFSGHIDGDGYCVYGIWYPQNHIGDAGLIPKMGTGSVKNLGVRYSLIRSTQANGAGGIIGYAGGVIDVEQCFTDESVTVRCGIAGGIVGLAMQNNPNSEKGLVIKNCYTKAKLSSGDANRCNGLIGNTWRTAYEIYDSYSLGSKPYNAHGDGGRSSTYWFFTDKHTKDGVQYPVETYHKAGKVATDYYHNIYSDTAGTNAHNIWNVVNKDEMYGENAKSYMSGLDFDNIWATVEEGTPVLKIFAARGLSGSDLDLSADAEIFTSGSGTQTDPYMIETVEHLRYLVQSETTQGKYYALANDIYINDTTKANWTLNNPAKWYTNLPGAAFKGTFDGNGYEIHGLYIDETPIELSATGGTSYVAGRAAGLFPFVDTAACIRNVHIRNSVISGAGSVGAIAGHMTGSSGNTALFVGCSVDESVTINGLTVGGLIGAGSRTPVRIYYSYCTANLKNTGLADRLNGLIGDIWEAQMEIVDCYVVGNRILRGGLSKYSNIYSDFQSSCAIVVPRESMYGHGAKEAMSGFDWKNIWYTAEGKTPQLNYITYEMSPIFEDEGVVGRVWSGRTATKFAGGKGTESNPYLIETPEQLAYLVKGNSKANTYYKLMADIKLNDTSKKGWEATANEWFTGYSFKGHFDGNYHIVSGLYFNKTDAVACGLFPTLAASTSIKRIGIVSSSITNESVSLAYPAAGALVGTLTNFDGIQGVNIGITKDVPPVISECFVGADVTIESTSVGGIIGNGPSVAEIYNCYSIPTLTYSYRAGAIFGDLWEQGDPGMIVENCYGATANLNYIGQGNQAGSENIIYKNVYVYGKPNYTPNYSTIRLFLPDMQGTRAKQSMVGFDWNNIWATVDGGTPVLKGFKFAPNHTSKREPVKVSIKFVTGEGATEIEPIYGYPMVTEVNVKDFPTPERLGYKFVGWYFYTIGDYKFNLTHFPGYDMEVYARWEKLGFEQGFEGVVTPEYDVNAGAEQIRPGFAGYNPRYTHGGVRSMHMKGDSTEAPMFLLYYQYKLEIGQKYKVSFFMTSLEDGATGKVEFLHANYADVNDEVVGSEVVLEFENIKGLKWVEYTCEITANAPYIIVRTTPGVDLFFDDFKVIPLGEQGKLGELDGFNPGAINAEPGSGLGVLWIILIVVGGVMVLGGVAALVIILVKKGKKKETVSADLPPEETITDSAEE